jgi:CPA1 family monovalent cation:H+ antiporter
MPGFDWRLGFLLGAVVSPTDAVAATSIARKVGMPQRIVDVLEGESLLNDATGLLAMEFGLQMIVSGRTPTIGHGVLQFLWLVVGGAGIGLLLGLIVWWFENWVDDGPVEIAVSLIVPYAAYLAGDEVHASGVIAVVACGLFLSRKSSTFFSPGVRLQTMAVWDALEFLLNGLVFILIGLQLPYVLAGLEGVSRWHLAAYGLVFSAVLIALRIVWMYPGARIAWLIRTKLLHQSYEMPNGRTVFVVGWTGMRGVLALAAAISLPYTVNGGGAFPQRSLIVFLTFSVILVTLVLQGLSLPMLIRRLKLDRDDGTQCEEGEARRILLQTAIDFLKEGRAQHGDRERHAYDDLLHEYEHKLEEVEECGPEAAAGDPQAVTTRGLLLETVRRERQELIELQRSGRIGDAVLRTLERELDLSESRLS